jgi:hypothetical protein
MDARYPGELGLCCIICSTSHRKARRRLHSPLLPLWSWWWGLRLGRWDFLDKRDLWGEFLKYHTQLPHVGSKAEASGNSIPIPAYQTIRTVLLSRLNYSPDTVDDTPFLQAQWDRITLAAIEGRVDVLNKTDDDIDAEMDAIDWDKLEAFGKRVFEAQ